MNEHRPLILTVVIALLGLAAARFIVHPLHARADELNQEHASLLQRIAGWPGEEAVLEPLRSELKRRTQMIRAEQRPVPAQPDLAGLIRRLSLDIDGERVIDQTFVAGRRGPAATGAPENWRSVPLTVELVADFPSLFGLLKRIEETPEPIRTTRLTIERLKDPVDRPLARCILVLDAIHRVKEKQP
ncbi:MAG: hypothetical protein MK085_02505 [Phycisphaerales bacterium]|nr:hypothetical protein [Phycisphaerales bacterium]